MLDVKGKSMSRIDEIKERRRKAAEAEERRGYNHPIEKPSWADVDYLLSCIEGRGAICVCDHPKSQHETYPDHDECLGCRGLNEPCSEFRLRATTPTEQDG